ncbi:sigma-70 family RNA polymerase sigma factor [Phytohabitans suffuscus]|uniref:RNA polymerase sigma factor SigL n=1 Tax=Phytohabitans suffuscus TaxID=624315 RepID=A0A6F8YK97_9ACTN|nr:sigma-70 family RNA polymerase sigma factor [Phytohabitans suffuscus]BCB86510.1 RNA polymerase sigma factor SigL [Phytohabitans suffuscus]
MVTSVAQRTESGTELERRMGAVVRDNAEPLLYFLLRLTRGQRELAEDLLQETMLRAWRRLDELPADQSAVRRWLFTVARHLTIDWARSRMARPPEVYAVDLNWVQSTDQPVDGLVDRFALRDALHRLTPEHRAVLVELYYGGASVAEVAARTGIPEGTVRSRAFYALRAARGFLGDDGSFW